MPEGIRNNVPVRLTLVMNWTEDKDIYQWPIDDLKAFSVALRIILPVKPVLSDQRRAFDFFCRSISSANRSVPLPFHHCENGEER
jgi:hypothetical protein